MIKKDPKEHLLAHSEAKVQLLNEYLSRYIRILSLAGYTSEIKIYDVFCGPGLYKDGGKGSPIVILDAINNFHNSLKATGKEVSTYFSCKFNDVEKSKVEKLKNNIDSQYGELKKIVGITITSNDYSEEIKTISDEVSEFDDQKGFVFIDPYGYKIKIGDIKNLVETKKVEVLLFLPIQFMYRFAKKEPPPLLREFMSDLDDEGNLPSSNSPFEYVKNLRDLFAKKMGRDNFVVSFLIVKDANTVFSLFFFCSHIRACEKMLEARWEMDSEQGRGWKYNVAGMDSLFADSSPETNFFEEKIIDYLRSGNRSNGEIFRFTIDCNFLPTHATEVLTKLQSEKKISVLEADGSKARKRSFYINYKDFFNTPNRVTISLI